MASNVSCSYTPLKAPLEPTLHDSQLEPPALEQVPDKDLPDPFSISITSGGGPEVPSLFICLFAKDFFFFLKKRSPCIALLVTKLSEILLNLPSQCWG